MDKKGKKIIIRRLIQSYLSSVISISLVLTLVGFLGILAVNAKIVTDYLKENIKLSVMMNDDVSSREAKSLQSEIEKMRFVKKAEFISKEQGAAEMKELLGEDFLEVFESNPIPYSIDVFLRADWFAADSIGVVKRELSGRPGVKELVYQESLVDAISGNMKKAGLIFVSVISLLTFVSLVLINNTVRLNIFARKETIRTMKMVGAKRSYIRAPFILRGFYQGLAAGIVSDLILASVLFYAKNEYSQLFSIVQSEYIIFVLVAILLLGISICVISTYSVINKLISAPAEDLYF